MENRIYHSCSCIIEFMKLVAKKEIKCEASLAFYLLSSTRLVNSIKHEHSCKILYIHYRRVTKRRPWSLGFNIIREKTRETLLLIEKHKGTNLPANRRSLISVLIIRYLKSKVRLFVLFDMIWFFTSHQQTFSYVGTGLPWLNQYKARINVSCSRTQRTRSNPQPLGLEMSTTT